MVQVQTLTQEIPYTKGTAKKKKELSENQRDLKWLGGEGGHRMLRKRQQKPWNITGTRDKIQA